MKDIHVPDILDREGDVPRPPAVFGRAYPVLLADAGPGACHAAHEFFHALLSNPHTGAPSSSSSPGASGRTSN